MEILLSPACESLTGILGRGFGYYIRSTKKGRFFGQRSKHAVPPDGHWRFILICAQLAQNGLYIADIKVNGKEVYEALKEAGIDADMYPFDFDVYNANWVLDLKNKTGL